jgi:CheY-like chemotaxis protein
MLKLGRILYAEDNAYDLDLALAAFEETHLVHSLDVVRDGQEAIDYFQQTLVDNHLPILAILDINMPKINGLDVLKRIKSNDKLKDVPVVILTSSQMESDLLKSYEYGVNAFVVKPIDYDEFTSVVRSIGNFWVKLNKTPYKV